MTTLIVWVAVDGIGPSAAYIVSDSRITWGAGKQWDSGRKLFSSGSSPDLFGYSGEAFFPSQALSHALDLADRSILWTADDAPEVRHEALLQFLQAAYRRRHNAPEFDFSIVHVARGVGREFKIWRIDYVAGEREWRNETIDMAPIAKHSNLLVALGSGAEKFMIDMRRWSGSAQGGTSRAVFGAFCDSLRAGRDPLSGGEPQIAGLTLQGPGQIVGFCTERDAFLFGSPVGRSEALCVLEWRDATFQRIDPRTLKLVDGAQRQVRPRMT
ncbi:hypothetical protein E3H11_05795 [Bradyrhizobium brasilense]|uniref:hypothetical protein n=1 Tax=Bradyrhizobium brasilense TaxID=1419277 RepID=UPI00145655DD|nr:hypothetical protein [Bradyrhizobium brasilense]NLS68436.1 hypothetical protein [Bradyrhizobium brasilense]